MSADGYQVDLDELRKLADQLSTGRDHMTAAAAALGNAAWKDLGSTEIDQAANTFQQSWKYGIDKLGEAAASLATGLQDTVTVYNDIEQTVKHDVSACIPPPSEGGDPVAPPLDQGTGKVTPISARLAGGTR
jgi:hypothetical protein